MAWKASRSERFTGCSAKDRGPRAGEGKTREVRIWWVWRGGRGVWAATGSAQDDAAAEAVCEHRESTSGAARQRLCPDRGISLAVATAARDSQSDPEGGRLTDGLMTQRLLHLDLPCAAERPVAALLQLHPLLILAAPCLLRHGSLATVLAQVQGAGVRAVSKRIGKCGRSGHSALNPNRQ